MGACTPHSRLKERDTLEFVFQLFPILKERRDQSAGTLSGGEQRMLSIARGLMSRPKLLMVDELSLGLAPLIVSSLYQVLEQLNEQQKISILIVEQYVKRALEFADRAYLLESGKIVLHGEGKELLKDKYIIKSYL